MDKWLWPYLRRPRPSRVDGVVDVLFCVCDHFEPFHGVDKAEAMARVDRWRREFPALARDFRDADGRSPAHTFFYPIEQYDEEVVAGVAAIGREAHTELEIHLHHDGDTAENLRDTLDRGRDRLAAHGALATDAAGRVVYGFIHGNWAVSNSHPAGRHCGVPDELAVLRETGCYADFTMPAAPDSSQARRVNSVYYPAAELGAAAVDGGEPMRVGGAAAGSGPLLVQGPLALNWRRRKYGLLPRLENAELSGVNPPRPDRVALWVEQGIHVRGRPEWVAIKLHTHGALPRNMATLLADPMRNLYAHLAREWDDGRRYRLHYVTARELVNILHAAEAGEAGNPNDYRDFRYRGRTDHEG